jgi:hypothetical protein
MKAKKRPLKRTYKRTTGPLPVLRPAGRAARPESKASEIKPGTGPLSEASRAVILRLVETVKGL